MGGGPETELQQAVLWYDLLYTVWCPLDGGKGQSSRYHRVYLTVGVHGDTRAVESREGRGGEGRGGEGRGGERRGEEGRGGEGGEW